MRNSFFLFSALHLFIVLLFLVSGLSFLIAPLQLRMQIVYTLSQQPHLFSLIGISCIGLGGLLLFGFYRLYRGQFYRVKMQAPHLATVEIEVIQEYIKHYWKKEFPDHQLLKEVLISHDQKIELVTALPPDLSIEEQEKVLKKAEKELGLLLAQYVGYDKEFFVTVISR